eukprot:SAG31_NODE_12514_length_936_cov_0.918757_1_plen_281_part_10
MCLSWWPAFDHAESAPTLGYLGFSGCMSGGADVGVFGPAPAEEDAAPAPPPTGLSLRPCESNTTSQKWKFLADNAEANAAACAKGAAECMIENEGNHQCLQISHCSTADGASIAADVACKKQSMCKGANLGWRYDSKSNALVSTLSKKCLTVKGGSVTQQTCTGESEQVFYYDPKTGHLGTSSSPNPVPTTCLQETAASIPGHRPSGPPKLSGWGGYESGPLAIFDASGRTLLLSPLTEHMSSVMNAGPNASAAVAVGVGGAVRLVPAGHSMQTILYSGHG